MNVPIKRPYFIAHRFDSKRAPENTLSALASANNAYTAARARLSGPEARSPHLAVGYEFDVQRARDGHFVVFHDDKSLRDLSGMNPLARLTNFHDVFPDKPVAACIEDLTWPEIQRLNVEGVGGPAKIPLLIDVLQQAVPGAFLDIEIKRMVNTDRTDGTEDRLLAVLQRNLPNGNPCCISSFDYGFLERFARLTGTRGLSERLPIGLISLERDRTTLDGLYVGLGLRYVMLQDHAAIAEDIERAHRRNVDAFVWQNPQIQKIEDITRILDAGADGVLSNSPNLLTTAPMDLLRRFAR